MEVKEVVLLDQKLAEHHIKLECKSNLVQEMAMQGHLVAEHYINIEIRVEKVQKEALLGQMVVGTLHVLRIEKRMVPVNNLT